ncbi:DUF3604 domain-containing protein [Teredinibacter franksiae]|uniref:DUF3604 domain-containing protein n=1 Tax=Teredinibacter franksiae TaxID=2761453 RepID=UPI001627BA6E|nr:DUF3604 domain-containing protein [Teredinibacter franksiae]
MKLTLGLSCLVALSLPLIASSAYSSESLEGMVVTKDMLSHKYPGKEYSPYAERDYPIFPLWGETHLHTGYSMDAGLFGARLGHEEAYKLAKGEQIKTSNGQKVKLSRPLDWLVITDHSDQMGMIQDVVSGEASVMKSEQAKRWHEGIKKGGNAAAETALNLIETFSQGKLDPNLIEMYSPGSKKYDSIWGYMVKTADEYNEPGRFTALFGFEWTSLVEGANMHRNVVFRDNADKVSQIVPYTTQKPLGSVDPLDLYAWLENYEAKTGGNALTLAHNGNLSNGIMFPVDKQYTGREIDRKYVEARAKWEVLYEITQIKGDGEAHPFLSPDDEFADYETWDEGNLDLSKAKTDDMLQYEYARSALKNGLLLEEKLGVNPYKFGFVGATDSHTGMPTAEEENFMGKHAGYEASPTRLEHPFQKTDVGERFSWQQVASGLQAVWAKENTREAIFDAMERKETYATTGPRISVRFFGGWDFSQDDLNTRQPSFLGYEKGVPMGGDLTKAKDKKAPSFMVYAIRDQFSANLDRIQIVKGWSDGKGKAHEKVYDVAWSGDRKINRKGKLPAVGNTVDIENASWENTIGASELATVWVDPEFNAEQSAFYYARVLEIPTPRWIVYDAFRFDIELPEGATTIGQERAYTSPIWYTP